jgi:hypothetical protein
MFGSWIRIRFRGKSWVRIRSKGKIQKLYRLKTEPRRAVNNWSPEAQIGAMEGPVVADSHHLDEDPGTALK